MQLLEALSNNEIYEIFQSGFRKLPSMGTALLRETHDLLLPADLDTALSLCWT